MKTIENIWYVMLYIEKGIRAVLRVINSMPRILWYGVGVLLFFVLRQNPSITEMDEIEEAFSSFIFWFWGPTAIIGIILCALIIILIAARKILTRVYLGMMYRRDKRLG